MFESLTGLANDAKGLILALATVGWLGATLAIGVVRRSMLATLGIFLAGGFLVWGMWNSDWVRDKSGEDVVGAPVVVEVEGSWTPR